jgi:hypothetical protein
MKSTTTQRTELNRVTLRPCAAGSALLKFLGLAGLLCALPARTPAQAPDVTIERGTDMSFDKDIIKSATALRKADKLLDGRKVTALLKAPQPVTVSLPAPARRPLSARAVYRRARTAFVRVGWFYKCHHCQHWHLGLANGYAIAQGGVVATAAHVLPPPKEAKQAYLIAATADGKVLPVTAILAVDDELDAGIVRVAGFAGEPLALNDNVAPGDTAFCLSDPVEVRAYFTTGIVNRFFWLDADSGDVRTLAGVRKLRLNVSTDWAPGSSGAPILDGAGNAIGHVSTIQGFSTPPDAESDTDRKGGDAARGPSSAAGKSGDRAGSQTNDATEEDVGADPVLQVHTAVPARGIRLLIQAMGQAAAKLPTTK